MPTPAVRCMTGAPAKSTTKLLWLTVSVHAPARAYLRCERWCACPWCRTIAYADSFDAVVGMAVMRGRLPGGRACRAPRIRASGGVPVLCLSAAALGARAGLAEDGRHSHGGVLNSLELAPGRSRRLRFYGAHQPATRSDGLHTPAEAVGNAGLDTAAAASERLAQRRVSGWGGGGAQVRAAVAAGVGEPARAAD